MGQWFKEIGKDVDFDGEKRMFKISRWKRKN